MSSTTSPILDGVDHGDPTPLHEQVAAEIRRAIAEGQAAPGERRPPARDLAAVLGVNRNTVLRALRLLRGEGLLEFRRGRGITVAGTPQRGAVLATAREPVRLACQHGYRREGSGSANVRGDRSGLLAFDAVECPADLARQRGWNAQLGVSYRRVHLVSGAGPTSRPGAGSWRSG